MNIWQLRELVKAYEKVQTAPVTYSTAISELVNAEDVESWLRTEGKYRGNVERWLEAEQRWNLTSQRISSEVYTAARRGWDEMKKYVPRLDGVDNFAELAPCIQFRYGAFAAAVLREPAPEEIKARNSPHPQPRGPFYERRVVG